MVSDRCDGDIEMNMRKAAHPSGGMGSSNPCRWRGERLHHGDGVCLLFVQMCRLVWSSSLVVCRQVPQNNLKMRLKMLLFAPHWLAPCLAKLWGGWPIELGTTNMLEWVHTTYKHQNDLLYACMHKNQHC